MKKTILTIMLAMAAMLSLQAQTITGMWVSYVVDEEAQEALGHVLNFQGNQVRQGLSAASEMGGVGTITLLFFAPAQEYAPSTKIINFQFDPAQVDMRLSDIEFIDELKNAIKENPAKEEELKQIVYNALAPNKDQMAKEGLLSGKYTIVSATDTKLVLKDPEGESMTFIRPE
jgi:hypothetical protein